MRHKTTISKKTLLGSAVIPLWVFAVQQALRQNWYVAGAAAAIAVGLFAIYEWVGIRSIPLDAEQLQDVSESIGEAAQSAVDSSESGNLPDGLERDPKTGQFRSKSSEE